METSKISNPKEKISAALGAFIFFLPHFTGEKTEFVVFYMKQSFGLFLISLGLSILNFLPFIWPLTMIVGILLFIVHIFLIIKAYSGEKFEVPYLLEKVNLLISKIDFLKNFFSPKN